jgi:hypothetical protein
MKTIKLITIIAVTGLTMLFTSCSETLNSLEDTADLASVDVKSVEISALCGTCDFSGTLTEDGIAGLMEMREEEKLARQVYLFLYEQYEYRVFSNIAKSENAHTSAVLHLINGYGLTDPTPAVDTEFDNPLFTELYAQLTEKGSVSLIEALKTGAFIEEYDIADLRRLLDETQNEDVKRVYGNLLRGSKFHLRAFTNVLKFQGDSYEPTILTNEEYLEILNKESDEEDETTATTFTPPATCVGTGPNS